MAGRSIDEFSALLAALGRRPVADFALVGGQAVHVWAQVFEKEIGDELERFLPLTSKDLDVATGSADLLLHLHRELGGRLRLGQPRQLTFGTLAIGEGDSTVEVDVLRFINGVGAFRAADTVGIRIGQHALPVLLPHLLLKGKLANAVELDQRDRQDVKHVTLLTVVMRQFLLRVVRETRVARERETLALLQEVLEIVTDETARSCAKRHRVSFTRVFPVAELLNATPSLKAFAKGELARARVP